MLGPLPEPPPAARDTVVVEGVQFATSPFDELQVSRIETLTVTPPPNAGTCVVKTTKRPSSVMAGS